MGKKTYFLRKVETLFPKEIRIGYHHIQYGEVLAKYIGERTKDLEYYPITELLH